MGLNMKQQKIKVYLCIDEHGNYRAIGSSDINDQNKNTAIAIIEDDIKKVGVNSITTTFNVNVDLPPETIPEPEEKETKE